MSELRRALAAHAHPEDGRRWLFVPYDQLSDAFGPLAREEPRNVGIILVECPGKAARRPYHKQKLALVLTSLRHFALEQAARGVAVRHLVADSYAAALAQQPGPILVMRPAERELRAELAPLVASGHLEIVPHEGWLTTEEDFAAANAEGRPWRMDAFYRHVRRRTGLLMARGKPVGGRFSFDTENRQAWKGSPPAPSPPTFRVDAITEEVCAVVRTAFGRHPGVLRPERLPAGRADVERAWGWAKEHCLPTFGPFEDAMSSRSRQLFHTQLSPLLNLQRLPVRRVVEEVAALDVPLPSKEGFVRQVLGWREYMRHVHEATDGFRVLRGEPQPCAPGPGDGGFETWSGEAWAPDAAPGGDGGSLTSALGARAPIPAAYWGKTSGLRCLDEVVGAVWEDGYSHHITRLMVLSNIAMLLDVAPRELTDWFWAAYIDAYDWVVEPNVHAMGTFGVGDLLTTKPYIAGAAYIDRMSDFCGRCRFDPRKTCPLTPMYWAFLGRHRDVLAKVDRMKLPLLGEARRTASQRAADANVFARVQRTLGRGATLAAAGEDAAEDDDAAQASLF
ncbi:MAG: deoxyribodipyrimidine photolyase [Labilithrix sp.]|nr:deoxyribodipyrimidine photolyase [Labilithrix sp.]